MFFISLLIFTVLAIAGSAAYFSIYGLAAIFSGIFIPVIIMGSSLEVGKLVAVSYLYRYWDKLTFLMKGYLFSAIFILMLITSAGIFGFLSMGYQQDVLPLQQKEQQIDLLEHEKKEIETLKLERLERRKQIDKDIASLPNNFVTGRQRLMESYGPELNQIRDDITQYTNRTREITLEIQQLKTQTLEQRAHTGPIIFIAQAFNVDIDQATKWIILLIIFVFDPLAVILTLGANIAVIERSGGKQVLFKHLSNDEHQHNEHPVQEVIQINSGMSAEELERILDERFNARDLSPEQQIQKTLVEEMLAKKKVRERIRNPRK